MTPSPSKSDDALDELEVVELTSAMAGPFRQSYSLTAESTS